MIKHSCSFCGANLDSDDALVGSEMTCPSCGAANTVPPPLPDLPAGALPPGLAPEDLDPNQPLEAYRLRDIESDLVPPAPEPADELPADPGEPSLGELQAELAVEAEEDAHRQWRSSALRRSSRDSDATTTEKALPVVGTICLVISVVLALFSLIVAADAHTPPLIALWGLCAAFYGLILALFCFAASHALHYLRRIASSSEKPD